MSKLFLYLGELIPQHTVSRSLGWFFSLKLPYPVTQVFIRLFILFFKVNPEEAEKPPGEYSSVQDYFCRSLKPGLRPITAPYSSPADGILAHSFPVTNSLGLQYKEKTYSAERLVFGEEPNGKIELAWATCVYLAPKNYHHVHSPVAGRLKKTVAIQGKLTAVNSLFAGLRANIFSENERMVFHVEIQNGGWAYIVMIGALNVGRIVSKHFPNMITNVDNREIELGSAYRSRESDISINCGDELGMFTLGSTAVIVLDKLATAALNPVEILTQRPISMGASLLTLLPQND